MNDPGRAPSRPTASGQPSPSIRRQINPRTVVVRRPTPWVAGNPAITEAGSERPGTVHERIPTRASKVRLPNVAVARHVGKAAVVIQIVSAVGVRRIAAVGVAGVLLVVLILLLIPLVKGIRFDTLGQFIVIVIREVELRSVVLAD